MKTIESCISWIDMMIGMHPNVEDLNYLRSIKAYLEKQEKEEK